MIFITVNSLVIIFLRAGSALECSKRCSVELDVSAVTLENKFFLFLLCYVVSQC